jgi:ABC-2 type transport system ATP-binding protein
MPAPLLELHALTRNYGAYTAVDHLSLAAGPGEIFGLLGSNGAGKTTTIKLLTTLLTATSGTATIAGFDIRRHSTDVRRSIGYVPQAISADGSLTARENLVISARLYDVPRRERAERVDATLAFVGLTEAANRLVRTYSGGMIRRLEIAQATIHRPRVLFLDEPTVGLDPIAREAVWEHLLRLRADHGTTLFLTTHYMEEAEQHCDRIAIMHRGKITALNTCAGLKSSIGGDATSLHDVFVHYASEQLETAGAFRETSARRATARRLG